MKSISIKITTRFEHKHKQDHQNVADQNKNNLAFPCHYSGLLFLNRRAKIQIQRLISHPQS